MGIVARQSIKNTIYSYLGVLIGTIYMVFMVPKIFVDNPEYWGALQLIMSYVLILLSFAMLGMPNTFIRFYPVFKEKRIGDFLFFGIIASHIGFFVVSILFYFLKDYLINKNDQSNLLFLKYFPYIFLILYAEIIFYILLNYARIFLKTSFPTFLKDTFLKGWTLLLIVAFWLKWITFGNLMFLYFTGYLIHALLMVGYLIKLKIMNIKISLYIFKSNYIKDILFYSFFSLLNGGAAILIGRIDIVMVGKIIDLEHVAYYATALLFITVLQVPVRSMNTIVMPILSDFISRDSDELKQLYKKSVINLTFTVGFIYLFIILNINEFMIILGDKFGQIKYVVILLATAKFFESINSLNPGIIVLSKYYKLDIVFQISLLLIAVITNYLLIPKFGMEGAAIATVISIFSVGIIRALFVYNKYGLSIIEKEVMYIILFFIVLIFLYGFFKFNINVYLSIFLKSGILTVLYISFLIITKFSKDINNFIFNMLKFNFLKK